MKAVDLTGQKFGRLTPQRRLPPLGCEGVLWRCLCDCGETTIVKAKKLKSGNTRSCGCLASELTRARNSDGAKHGMTGSRTFTSWDSMKQRCLNINHDSYNDYGGRGITICDDWLESFNNFYADMGERPAETTLDRIDTNGNYEPSNCRWATSTEQANNRRSSRFVTFEGKTMTVAEWSSEMGVPRQTLRYRLDSGWTKKEALTMKTNHGNGWIRGVRE